MNSTCNKTENTKLQDRLCALIHDIKQSWPAQPLRIGTSKEVPIFSATRTLTAFDPVSFRYLEARIWIDTQISDRAISHLLRRADPQSILIIAPVASDSRWSIATIRKNLEHDTGDGAAGGTRSSQGPRQVLQHRYTAEAITTADSGTGDHGLGTICRHIAAEINITAHRYIK